MFQLTGPQMSWACTVTRMGLILWLGGQRTSGVAVLFAVKGFSFARRFLRSRHRRICLEATTAEIESLTPRLVSTVASVAVATKGRAALDAA